MIKESTLGGTITVSIVSEIKVVDYDFATKTVILETMGEQKHIKIGNSLDLQLSGIYNLSGGHDA